MTTKQMLSVKTQLSKLSDFIYQPSGIKLMKCSQKNKFRGSSFGDKYRNYYILISPHFAEQFFESAKINSAKMFPSRYYKIQCLLKLP